MRAIVYLRVSTEEQQESGLGLEAQRDACDSWCVREGLEIPLDACVLTDVLTGATPPDQRPGLVSAIAAMEAGDVLLVAKRDRLGRDPILVAMIERACGAKKCRVVSAAGEGTDNDDPSNILMRRLVDAFAEYERLMIRFRTTSALAAKRKRGERTGTIPYGFRVAPDGKTLTPAHDERVVIDAMLSDRALGLSDRQIAARLTASGVATKQRAAKWSPSAVKSILSREAPSHAQ